MLDRIALIITIIGSINWGLIGLFQFDLVAWICGGSGRASQPHRVHNRGRLRTVVHWNPVQESCESTGIDGSAGSLAACFSFMSHSGWMIEKKYG